MPTSVRSSALIAAALVAGLSALPARAADPIAGQSKFTQICAACHSVASTAVVDRGRNNPAMIQNAINNIPQMNAAVAGAVTAADLADIAAYLGNSPGSLSFSQTSVGQSSAVSTVTVSASRLAALSNLSASASGDFAIQGGTCGTSVAAGTSCTVGVVFRPLSAGSRSGSLSLSHSGLSTAVPIALAGTAVAALQAGLSADASSLTFGAQTVGSSSAAQTVTLSNTGTASLDFSSIALSGSQASDFSRSGSCAVGTPLAVGASCTLVTRFTPSAAGTRTASLNVAATAPAANGSVTLSVGLSGTGQVAAAPQSALSASSLDFGSVTVGSKSPAQTLTLSNTGTAALSLNSISTSSPYSVSHDCGSSVAAGARCTLSLSFTPSQAGASTGSLSVSSNAPNSPQTVSLSGSGVLASTAVLAWSGATSADFGTVQLGSDAGLKHFSLSNTGTAAAKIGSFSLSGDAAADYRIDASSSCSAGLSLAAGASCDLAIGFSPRAVGSRSAQLAVAADNATLPGSLTLAGVGQGAAQPVLQLSSSALEFSSSDTSRPLTLSNSGKGTLTISGASLSSARFSLDASGSGSCGSAPFSVQPGASCQLLLRWSGSATETGTLTLQGDMSPATQTVALNASATSGSGSTTASNSGGGGCTLGAGTAAVDPLLWLMAGLSGLLLWRRRAAR